MYAAAAGGQVDHELYLLGKPVDKAVDPMAQGDEEVCSKLFITVSFNNMWTLKWRWGSQVVTIFEQEVIVQILLFTIVVFPWTISVYSKLSLFTSKCNKSLGVTLW